MFDLNAAIEGFLRLFVLMLPVAGILLLFVAAHLVGGALNIRRAGSRQPDPTSEGRQREVQSHGPHHGEHRDSQPTHAA